MALSGVPRAVGVCENGAMRRILGLLLPLVVFATASLGADLPALQKEVERIRGLSFRAPVAVKEVDPARLREVVRAELEREFPKDEWPRTEKVLKAFALIPPRMNLRAVLEGLLEDQVAGLYDPKSRTLYVSTSPLEGEEMLAEAGLKDFSLTDLFLVHELDHALTDQHFGLLSLPLEDRENEDRASAARCLAEGDATWVMVEYLGRRLSQEKAGGLDALGDEAAAMALGRELLGQSAPAYIQENLLFGYLGGLGLVRAALARGGTGALDGLYRRPPASTEQVLHPEKALEGKDPPVKVEAPAGEAWRRAGWRKVQEGTWGEFNTRVLLKEWGVAREAAERAASDWGGDRWAVFEKGALLGFDWKTVWDTEGAAARFAAAARTRKDLEVKARGREVEVSTPPPAATGSGLEEKGRPKEGP